jgi:hypothetical protein
LNLGRSIVAAGNKRCAVGLAIEEIEAWLLADEKALRTALADPSIQRQPDPESFASRDDTSDQNPKGRLERLIIRAKGHGVLRGEFPDYYGTIAAEIDMSILENRCSEGFGAFAQQVRAL